MVIGSCRSCGSGDCVEKEAQGFGEESPQVCLDEADVVAGAAEDCVKGVAKGPLEGGNGRGDRRISYGRWWVRLPAFGAVRV